MSATNQTQSVETYEFVREETIDAPIKIVWESVLDELGPESQMPDGTAFPLKLEAFPGGRWFRDLGNNTGHLWGHVQVLKPPALIEICGPMFMSYPSANHLQYRLTPDGKLTRLKITHKSMGLIPRDHMDNMAMGWNHIFKRIHELVRQRLTAM